VGTTGVHRSQEPSSDYARAMSVDEPSPQGDVVPLEGSAAARVAETQATTASRPGVHPVRVIQ
jgi:hypothetical protein